MNKTILFIALIIFAGGAMWSVDYFSAIPPVEDVESSGVVQEPKVVRDFKSFCDTLSKSMWNNASFQERVDRLNVYRSQKIVNSIEFLNLEEYMYSAYANSLINSYTDWKNSCNVSKLNVMHAEMRRISVFNTACSSKLQASIKEINSFNLLLGMPNKLKKIISVQYNETQYNELKKEIDALPSHFSRCNNVNRIKQNTKNELNDFHYFIINYNDAMSVFQMNQKDVYTLKDLKKLCSKAKENNYIYYKDQLNEKNVCY